MMFNIRLANRTLRSRFWRSARPLVIDAYIEGGYQLAPHLCPLFLLSELSLFLLCHAL